MTFEAHEISEQHGAPVELYEFLLDEVTYRYTSSEIDVTVDGTVLYESIAIERSRIALSSEAKRNSLTITVPRDNPIADRFRTSPSDASVGVVVKRYHRDDVDAQIGTIWSGRVLNCVWEGTSFAKLSCEPASISLKRNGIGRVIQLPCPYALFNQDDCKVDKELFRHTTTVSSVSGVTIGVASVGSHPYLGGILERSDGNSPPLYERRLIVGISGTTLTVNRPFSSIAINDDVSVFPGCDHTTTTCHTVYNNILRFGGFPFLPKKNPFTGAPIF